jgi:hypothetical protein
MSTTTVPNTLQENISGKLNEFSDVAKGGFGDANGIIAKFGFFILVIILFLLALNLGTRLIAYFMTPPNKIVIIKGTADGKNKKIIKQDPKDKDSKLIRRSNNELSGIEFTWSLWLRIDGLSEINDGIQYRNIFVKGDGTLTNAPGVYLHNSSNTLRILMDTSSKYAITETSRNSTQIINIPNIPMKKWFHLVIRCQNKYLDVYINGLVVFRSNLINVPLQNYDDVIICNNGGFNGKLSNLTYYGYSLNATDINGISYSGPDLTDVDNMNNQGNVGSDYLSTLWYKG